MEKSGQESKVIEVIRRWMPELERVAKASGQAEPELVESALRKALPETEEVDLEMMLADARGSGLTPAGDLAIWLRDQKDALKRRLARNP